MHRFFVKEDCISGQEVTLTEDNAAHAHVLRLRIGELIVACFAGIDYFCEVTVASKGRVVAQILRNEPNNASLPVQVTLFQCLPKGSKMSDIIENATELGVFSIVPAISKRTIAKDAKPEKWQKQAESAAKLSHRGDIPSIGQALKLEQAINCAKDFDHVFACYELEKDLTMAQFMRDANVKSGQTMAFFIGPEGGFDPTEIELFEQAGITAVSLGKRILRTQSASSCVLANINFYLEDLNK